MSENSLDEQALAGVASEIKEWRKQLRNASAGLTAATNPQTGGDAVVDLGMRVASIASTGMLGAADGDIYAARALLRIASEHWIRLMLLVSDVRDLGEQMAGERYWKDLRRAENVKADKQVRDWFPAGLSEGILPEYLRAQIKALLLDPEPSAVERKTATETINRYSFKNTLRDLLSRLDDPTTADRETFGTIAASYPVLSGCIHAGPDAHKWLLGGGWQGRLAVAVDLATVWASVLVFVHTHQAGGNQLEAAVAEARALQGKLAFWAGVVMARIGLTTPGTSAP
jgi:hypothetical protein